MAPMAFEREFMKDSTCNKVNIARWSEGVQKSGWSDSSLLWCTNHTWHDPTTRVDLCDITLKVGQMSCVNTKRKLPSKIYMGTLVRALWIGNLSLPVLLSTSSDGSIMCTYYMTCNIYKVFLLHAIMFWIIVTYVNKRLVFSNNLW